MTEYENINIGMPKVLLVEGKDAELFCTYSCRSYGIEDFQVIDFGGNNRLKKMLELLKISPNFADIETLLIIRDAEELASGAIDSIRDSLRISGYVVPKKPGVIEKGDPNVAYYLFPGPDESGVCCNGTLEDLCIASLDCDKHIECIDVFLETVKSIPVEIHNKKSKLHSFLSSNKKFAGLKLGEASKANAWQFHSPALAAYREFLVESLK